MSTDNVILLLAIALQGVSGAAWFLYWCWVAFFKPTGLEDAP